jgi:hypothetical protein
MDTVSRDADTSSKLTLFARKSQACRPLRLRGMRTRVLALALVLIASSNLLAQVVIDVEVVDVPVFVARENKPVEGLTADRFELRVNGKPQPIEYFEAVSARDAASSLRERRLFLLMFDVAFSQPFALPRARAAAQLIANAGPRTTSQSRHIQIAGASGSRRVRAESRRSRARDPGLNSSRSGDPLASMTMPNASGRRLANIELRDTEAGRDLARMELLRAAETRLRTADVSERLALSKDRSTSSSCPKDGMS